jgi:hypothetical protein
MGNTLLNVMAHRFASALEERRKGNYAKDAKTPPTRDGISLIGSTGAICTVPIIRKRIRLK